MPSVAGIDIDKKLCALSRPAHGVLPGILLGRLGSAVTLRGTRELENLAISDTLPVPFVNIGNRHGTQARNQECYSFHRNSCCLLPRMHIISAARASDFRIEKHGLTDAK